MASNETDNVTILECHEKWDKAKANMIKDWAEFYNSAGLIPLPLWMPGETIRRRDGEKKAKGKEVKVSWHIGKDTVIEEYTKDKLHYFKGLGKRINIGAIPGNQYVDIDLDCDIARELADDILPETGWQFGRTSASGGPTHWLYKLKKAVKGGKRTSFTFTTVGTERKGTMILEYRTGYGCQTMLPPSMHGSGVELKWVNDPRTTGTQIGECDAAELKKACRLLSIVCVLCRDVVEPGTFHNSAVFIAGGLCHAGYSEAEARRAIEAIAGYTGQEGLGDRLKAVTDTYAKKRAGGGNVGGWNGLEGACGTDLAVIRKLKDLSNAKPDAADDFDSDRTDEEVALRKLVELAENCYLWPTDRGTKVIDLTRPRGTEVLLLSAWEHSYGEFSYWYKKKRIKITQSWRDGEKKQVAKEKYKPGEGQIIEDAGAICFNPYVPPSLVPVEGEDEMGVFYEHMEYLFPQYRRREYFLDILAHIVQRPMDRLQFVPLITSNHINQSPSTVAVFPHSKGTEYEHKRKL